MYHRQRRRITLLLLYTLLPSILTKSVDLAPSEKPTVDPLRDNFENNIIDFDEDHSIKFNKNYGSIPWESSEKFNKETHRYTLIDKKEVQNETKANSALEQSTEENEYSVIPLELISTTQDDLLSLVDSTTEADLTVIPLSTTKRVTPIVEIDQPVTLPSSTPSAETSTESFIEKLLFESEEDSDSETTTIKRETNSTKPVDKTTDVTTEASNVTTTLASVSTEYFSNQTEYQPTTEVNNANESSTTPIENKTVKNANDSKITEVLKTNSSKVIETVHKDSSESQEDVQSFSELDTIEQVDVPEDYYDSKDVVPTTAPKTDAISVFFGLAGSVVESVVESVAERVVPKSIFDLFKRMQKQNEALEAERLRSREENGGLGQFGRGILKSISTGLSKPLSQLMQGVKDIGSLDTDRGFVGSVASGVTSVATVANSVVDAFKDRVQAIYPGTVWCGDGHSAQARSSDLGLFFFTDTCCRQHDACKIYIRTGDTKYGLTNTGLFTRSHCSCDAKFRECLRKTNSLVSAQIGLTYFNVLGPQCFRKAHPIVKCARRTRITGQKCEEYELDITKPKMWQWFDNETF